MVRRLVRIAPLYWIVTAAYAISVAMSRGRLHDYGFGIEGYLSALLFLPFRNGAGELFPPVGQGWTLVYEMFFYVVLAAVAFKLRSIRTQLLMLIFTALALAHAIWSFHNAYWEIYTNSILLEFAFGCVIAEFVIKSALQPCRWVAAALTLTGFFLICIATPFRDGELPRAIYWGLPAAVLVFGAVHLERYIAFSKMRIVQAIGDSSYSLYLTHDFVLYSLFAVPLVRSLGISAMPAQFAVCWLAGYICYIYIESPITRLLKERSVNRAARARTIT